MNDEWINDKMSLLCPSLTGPGERHENGEVNQMAQIRVLAVRDWGRYLSDLKSSQNIEYLQLDGDKSTEKKYLVSLNYL